MLTSLQTAIAGLGTGDPLERIIGTKSSGPGGIHSTIEFNTLLLNDRSWVDCYLVTDVLGVDDADVRDSRENNPQAHGETPGNAFYGGRTISLQGKIVTKTLWKMEDMKQALRAAFADISVERQLIFHGPDVQRTYFINCKKSQKLDIPDKQDRLNDFVRPFNIILRASMPWFLGYQQSYLSWVYAGSATVNAIVFKPVNQGNYPSRPYIELTGPMTTPALSNADTGQIISFTSNIPAGEVWVMDFTSWQPRIYRKSDGAPRWGFVSDSSSDLIEYGIPPFTNSITFSASGLTAASKVESWHRDTIM